MAARTEASLPWNPLLRFQTVMIGALPLMILVASPQRVALSLAVAATYLVGGIIIGRRSSGNRVMAAFVVVASVFMLVSLLRVELQGQAPSDHLDYALAKAGYFVAVVLPMSAGVALLISRAEDLKPAARMFFLMGIVLAVLTIALRQSTLLGSDRYTWQGNLMAVAGVILFQFWIVRRGWLILVLGFVVVLGISLDSSRQSVVALAIGMVTTVAYWLLADLKNSMRIRRLRLTKRSLVPGLAAVFLTVGWTVWFLLSAGVADRIAVFSANPTPCNCVVDRFVYLLSSPGDRGLLFSAGPQFFLAHPWVGSGLASFMDVVPGERYPHNIFLEIGGELGLVGLAVLILPMARGWIFLFVAGVRRGDPAIAGLFAVLVVFAVIAALQGDIAGERAFWIFGTVALKLGINIRAEASQPRDRAQASRLGGESAPLMGSGSI
jgi:hypothetical protein